MFGCMLFKEEKGIQWALKKCQTSTWPFWNFARLLPHFVSYTEPARFIQFRSNRSLQHLPSLIVAVCSWVFWYLHSTRIAGRWESAYLALCSSDFTLLHNQFGSLSKRQLYSIFGITCVPVYALPSCVKPDVWWGMSKVGMSRIAHSDSTRVGPVPFGGHCGAN